MLSRVAESLFWMSRYLERAQNIARFIEVNWHLILDTESRNGNGNLQWEPLINVTGDDELFAQRYGKPIKKDVIKFLALDADYPHSILSCLRSARENARSIREIIPLELWEQINIGYHLIEESVKNAATICENPYDLCREIKLRGMMLGGIANATMSHGEGWHFFHMGRLLERADKTSRILDVKYFILLPSVNFVGTSYDDVQWTALLRTIDGVNAYRQLYGKIFPAQITEFLILNREFPRAILYCLLNAQESLHKIGGTAIGGFQNAAERRLGHLCAQLSYTKMDDVFQRGLHEFIGDLQLQINNVGYAVAETFFGLTQVIYKEPEQNQDQEQRQ